MPSRQSTHHRRACCAAPVEPPGQGRKGRTGRLASAEGLSDEHQAGVHQVGEVAEVRGGPARHPAVAGDLRPPRAGVVHQQPAVHPAGRGRKAFSTGPGGVGATNRGNAHSTSTSPSRHRRRVRTSRSWASKDSLRSAGRSRSRVRITLTAGCSQPGRRRLPVPEAQHEIGFVCFHVVDGVGPHPKPRAVLDRGCVQRAGDRPAQRPRHLLEVPAAHRACRRIEVGCGGPGAEQRSYLVHRLGQPGAGLGEAGR